MRQAVRRDSDDHPLGQLCPYQDCCHDLAFDQTGWWECGHCGRAFYATDTDSDYEDFHCHRAESRDDEPPADLPVAKDLGPSWATPEEGEERGMNQSKRSLLRRVWNRLLDALMEPVSRAMSLYRIQDQIWQALNPPGTFPDEWAWPVNLYLENDALFVIVAQGGKLYRQDIAVAGETVTLGPRVQVTETFPAVGAQGAPQRGAFTVRRQADGRHRWLMIAATAILNRVGELDSTALFDSFIRRAEESGEYPRLDFYHLGREDPAAWEFGQADYLARDGVCYVASGLFDEEHPLARATIAAAEREPGRWGASIEFRALMQPEQIVAEPDVRIPVYQVGVNTRISVVLEREAAGWYTTLGVAQEVSRMRDDILEKLRQLFGDDEQALDAFAAGVDGVNRAVTEEGLITRQAAAGRPDADADDEDLAELDAVELDDDAVAAIVAQMAQAEYVTTLIENNAALIARVQELSDQVTELAEHLATRTDGLAREVEQAARRMQALERSDAEKQRDWAADLPASKAIRVTHRPRQAGPEGSPDEDEAPASYADAAEKTLAKLPAY